GRGPVRRPPGLPALRRRGPRGPLGRRAARGAGRARAGGTLSSVRGARRRPVCAPPRVARGLGPPAARPTNAAGGIRAGWGPGTLVLLEDQLNLTRRAAPCDRPPAGAPAPPYDPALRALARACASELGVPLREGVYAGLPGPSYETPAEIR